KISRPSAARSGCASDDHRGVTVYRGSSEHPRDLLELLRVQALERAVLTAESDDEAEDDGVAGQGDDGDAQREQAHADGVEPRQAGLDAHGAGRGHEEHEVEAIARDD